MSENDFRSFFYCHLHYLRHYRLKMQQMVHFPDGQTYAVTMLTRLEEFPCRVSCILTGILSRNASTWLMMPTFFPPIWCRFSRASMTVFRHSALSVPNPSSMNSVLTCKVFAARDDSPRARASDTRNDSPPERVLTERSAPPWYMSRTVMVREPL